MKIAFYCPNKPLSHPNPSGDLVIARGIQSSLNALGHECTEISEFRSRFFWKKASGWGRAAASLVRTYRKAFRCRPELWLTYHTYYKSPDILGPWISRLLKIPYVLFQPMYATRRRKVPETRLGFYMNQMALRHASHAFSNNINDLEALRRILPPSRITYLRPGIFPEQFRRDENHGRRIRHLYHIPLDALVLMTAARFRPGVKFQSMVYLLESLALLKGLHERLVLLAVGDGPMEAEVRELGSRLLSEQVVFAGKVRREKMFHYYSAADLFVYPGIGESLGMVFLEAQACGLPVVALDTAGVPQVVRKNETGLLVRQDNGQAMAEAIETILKDPETRTKLSRNATRYVSECHNLHRNYLRLSAKLEEIEC